MDTSGVKRELKRGLGLLDSVMIVVGVMIGSGIFIVSADIARTVGSPGNLLLVWLITGVLTMIGALSYGELAVMMPEAGGQYVFLREAYNPLVGFLYGWTFFMVIQTGTIAAVGVAFAKFTAVLVPWFSEQHVLVGLLGLNISTGQVLGIVAVVVLTGVNVMGLREGKMVQNVFTIAKTAALIAIIALGLVVAKNPATIATNLAHFWDATWTHTEHGAVTMVEALSGWKLLAALGAAMVGSLFASDSWHDVALTGSEVIDPHRTLPRSLALGAGIVTILYILTNVSYILLLPVAGTPGAADVLGKGIQFAEFDRVGTAAASVIFGDVAVLIMAVLIMISTFGCMNGLILAGARVYYAMARDGLFFRSAGSVNTNSVPAVALIIQGTWASVLCLSGAYSDLLDYVIFAVLLFYILTIGAIFALRRKRPDAPRPYKAFGYPLLQVLYIVVALLISVDLLIYKPRYTWPGLAIVLLGIPVYALWKRTSSR